MGGYIQTRKKNLYLPDLESDKLAKADTTFNAASKQKTQILT